MGPFPRSVSEIYGEWSQRRRGLLQALTADAGELFRQCDPARESLCLSGERDGTWRVGPPAAEVPAELPEPCLGVNHARDGMAARDWLALLAAHSDAWLMAVAFFYALRLSAEGRARLFARINAQPTLFQLAAGGGAAAAGGGGGGGAAAGAAEAAAGGGATRLLRPEDIAPSLQGREGELYWPDDDTWYAVEIGSVDAAARSARVTYVATGEVEQLCLDEIARDRHLRLRVV